MRLQSSLQEKDGGKAKSDALVRRGTQTWTQRVPTNEHVRALEGPAAWAFLWVCSSVGRGPLPPGELPLREGTGSRSPVEPAVAANDQLLMYLPGEPVPRYPYYMVE